MFLRTSFCSMMDCEYSRICSSKAVFLSFSSSTSLLMLPSLDEVDPSLPCVQNTQHSET